MKSVLLNWCVVIAIVSASFNPGYVWAGSLSKQTRASSMRHEIQKLRVQIDELRQQLRETRDADRAYVDAKLQRSAQSHSLSSHMSNSKTSETGNMVFFRGGGVLATSDRSNEVFTDVFGLTGAQTNSDKGYYIGAGLDQVLSKDLWGMWPGIWAVGEIGVEFKRFSSKSNVTQAVPSTCAFAGVPGCAANTNTKVQITMLTVDVAPKIKFMEGSRFRPWIIPIGLDFHVISPPSNDTTVLDVGAQFGIGAEFRVWKAFHLGVDGRFHLATGQTDTVNNFGTAGGYVGIAY